jgi:hypothetical protein
MFVNIIIVADLLPTGPLCSFAGITMLVGLPGAASLNPKTRRLSSAVDLIRINEKRQIFYYMICEDVARWGLN